MKIDKYRVEDFLQDESFFNWVKRNNTEDIKFWETWWKDHPEQQDKAKQAIGLITGILFEDKNFDKIEISDLWDRIKESTIDQENKPRKRRFQTSNFFNTYLLKVAAVITPFILAAIFYMYNRETVHEQFAASQQKIVREIPRGQKLTIYLPDGSRVKLNSESSISYQKPFDEDQRVITLEGEAFFEVTPDPNRPFRVLSGAIETRVLGTSFNVSAYSDEDHVEISVVTGKVSVENITEQDRGSTGQSIVLSPAEQATYFEETNKTVVSDYNPKKVLAWNNGTLYFDNASMDEFVTELERWYGIDIIIDRERPIKRGIVGEFRDQSLEEILLGMHVASEFEYEFINGKVFIR